MAAIGWQRGGRPGNRGRAGGHGRDLARSRTAPSTIPRSVGREGRRQDFSTEDRDLPRSAPSRPAASAPDRGSRSPGRSSPWTGGRRVARLLGVRGRSPSTKAASAHEARTLRGHWAPSPEGRRGPCRSTCSRSSAAQPCRLEPARSSVPGRSSRRLARRTVLCGAALGIAQCRRKLHVLQEVAVFPLRRPI